MEFIQTVLELLRKEMLKSGAKTSWTNTISERELNAGMTRFESFCQRTWLDYCDEHNDLLSEHLSFVQYYAKYEWWLVRQYERRNRLGCK